MLDKLNCSERLLATDSLVQGIAHEIRNPITAIGGFARRIKKRLNGEPEIREYIDIILQESERLENLVTRVSELSNILSPRLMLDDVSNVLNQIVDRFGPRVKKQGVSLETDIRQGLPLAEIDSSQLITAFSNIIENALEAMPNGGKIILKARRDGDHIMITIADTGRGISEKHVDSLYDPFFTSKTRGSGLGLTIVRQVAENHKAGIRIESNEKKGALVALCLPIKQ